MNPVRLLFVSYWSASEPLIASMVLPYVRLLAGRGDVEHITLVTLGSNASGNNGTIPAIPKVTHRTIDARKGLPHILSKAELSLRTARVLADMIREDRLGLVLAATSMAGAPAHAAARRTGIPYAVYCFEPHAEYMAECGEWSRAGARYRFARHMARVQLRHAFRIMTVTDLYRQDLVDQGTDAGKLRTMPCVIDTDAFRFSPAGRDRVRAELGLPDGTVLGVYAGKFGGLYYDAEAFTIFRTALDRVPGSHMLVLSTMDPGPIHARARAAGIAPERFHLRAVPHTDVPAWLSAADLAFSTIRPTPSKRGQCPVKNGEYWSTGLPILMSDGIGDDHLLLRQGIGGAVLGPQFSDLGVAMDRVTGLMRTPGMREELHRLAVRTRSLTIAEKILNDLVEDHLKAISGAR